MVEGYYLKERGLRAKIMGCSNGFISGFICYLGWAMLWLAQQFLSGILGPCLI
ncbi:hypothetical protein LOK49_LG13G01882 [Camellia lanceoleosa]|uniref:Uncharacterized protein n=1 Tax=Camellia lanceoleosa TaxID=1840588 RepID=A0ACC0FJU8_9ERIC|nr:hypothetical protein LOK49_LG13G01882 [Camellia lanceoleosa]